MPPLTRRSALQLLGGVPAALGLGFGAAETSAASQHAARAVSSAAKGTPYKPRFFTAHEWKTVRVLADSVIPKDERSGSATDAGVPEFIDFLMGDTEVSDEDRRQRQVRMRGGLAWIDTECRRRFAQPFVDARPEQQTAFLDEISDMKGKEEAAAGPGHAFFNSFRDLVASGFFTTKMGMADLGYMGNVPTVWTGPAKEDLRKLGLED